MLFNSAIEDRRQKYLDWLYERSLRTSGLYTGLFQERLKQLAQKDMDESIGPLGDWH